jgi:hypothetical protein
MLEHAQGREDSLLWGSVPASKSEIRFWGQCHTTGPRRGQNALLGRIRKLDPLPERVGA